MNLPSTFAQKDRNFAVPAMAKRRGFCRRLLLLSVFLLVTVICKLTTALRRCLPRLAGTGTAAIVKDRRTTVRAPVVVVVWAAVMVVMAVFWLLFFCLLVRL